MQTRAAATPATVGQQADIGLGVNASARERLDQLRENATVIGILNARLDEEVVADLLVQRSITALSMGVVPRDLAWRRLAHAPHHLNQRG